MNDRLNDDTIAALRVFGEFLASVREDRYATYFRNLARDFAQAGTRHERRELAGLGLATFGGMNSLNDLVLGSNDCADRDANQQLEELRMRVYDWLVQEL